MITTDLIANLQDEVSIVLGKTSAKTRITTDKIKVETGTNRSPK